MGGYGVGGGSVSLRAWRDKIGYLFYMSSSELVGGFLYKVLVTKYAIIQYDLFTLGWWEGSLKDKQATILYIIITAIIYDYYRTRVRSLAMLVTHSLTH